MGRTHGRDHPHDRPGAPDDGANPLRPAFDLSISDSELAPAELGRRSFLRAAGLLGAGGAAASVLGRPGSVAADDDRRAQRRTPRGGYHWLAGDHHIHTLYSSDAQYRVLDHVRHASAYGLDWMVITDHGSDEHAKIGVEKVNPDIVAARDAFDQLLVFQGLEWNIPAAEHGTVFVHPGTNEVAVLKEFENGYDGVVNKATVAGVPANEALAVAGLHFLADAVGSRQVRDALMLANHPARKGLDSPHEIRGWRDAEPRIAIGMEGAPGHQAAGLPAPNGRASSRGMYDASRSADSFGGYPDESYRTYGGFDWMTSTVGGLWDSLLAEGKAWWISANSDSHQVWADTSVRSDPRSFARQGYCDPPIHRTAPQFGFGDFWPGYYSRTHVGARDFGYGAVMDGMRTGRVWVDHGSLLQSLDVRLRAGGDEVPLGGVLSARRGTPVRLVARIVPAQQPNWSQFRPRLATIDLIRGEVTGPVAERDTFTAPATRVIRTWDASAQTAVVELSHELGPLDESFYVRLRGSDGKRTAPGLRGAAVDPAGPQLDVVGAADPWDDLWFYTNPMWALAL